TIVAALPSRFCLVPRHTCLIMKYLILAELTAFLVTVHVATLRTDHVAYCTHFDAILRTVHHLSPTDAQLLHVTHQFAHSQIVLLPIAGHIVFLLKHCTHIATVRMAILMHELCSTQRLHPSCTESNHLSIFFLDIQYHGLCHTLFDLGYIKKGFFKSKKHFFCLIICLRKRSQVWFP
ncbi:hypothetical protein L9F63_005083, partial [Diploptera punctata]